MKRRSTNTARSTFRAVAAIVASLAMVVPLSAVGGAVSTTPAVAASGTFDPGLIISDSLFYDRNAMTASEIQTFLDSKIGTCQNGRCLNIAMVPFEARATRYSPDFPDRVICEAIAGGTYRFSDLLYLVQRACSISAKVILATLHKEQGLITKKSPDEYSLRFAMGYACPDSSGCSDANAGLGVQLYQGARQLHTYKVGEFGRQPGSQYVAYSPNASCGGTTVNVRNYATAALYNYTPYQPNAAALANLSGHGDSCSSYGNRNFWAYYTNWFGSTTDIIPNVSVRRIGGANRYEVSAKISAEYFSPGLDVVYIASGEGFPDAISAGSAAAEAKAPVLLVETRRIPASIAAELTRLAPARIVVVGGPATVDDSVYQQLESYAPLVDRIGGADRYAVARDVVADTFDTASVAYLATGAVFADALSSGAAAGSKAAPVILVEGSRSAIDEDTWRLLQSLGVTQVVISGGPGSVSAGIEASLMERLGSGAVTRFGGANRFAVSTLVNQHAFGTAGVFFVASGDTFPDALSATPAAAGQGGPLYVTPPNCLTRAHVQHMIDAGATEMVIVGGPASVGDSAARFSNC